MHIRSNRGAAPIVYIVAVAVLALGAWLFKPKALDWDSRRAEKSAVATANVERATNKQAAEAAASVAKIGEANAVAPDSKQKDFIAQEVPVALAKLPAPDPQALLDAERRRVAVTEGKLEEARSLYARAMSRADELAKQKEEALVQRHAIDIELQRVAAERLGAEHERNMFLLVAGVAVALYLYVKLTHVSPGALAEAVSDIKAGKLDPLHAIDAATSRLQQRVVSWIAHFKAKP